MKVFLDSNLLIYMNTMTDERRNDIDAFFRKLLGESLYTNLLTIDETLYVSRKRFRVPYEATLDFLRNIILPYTEVIPIEEEDIGAMASYLTRYELKPSDSIHIASMEKRGVVHIASEDEDFDKVEGLKRIWLETSPEP